MDLCKRGVLEIMNKKKKAKEKWVCEQFEKLEQSLQLNKDWQLEGR